MQTPNEEQFETVNKLYDQSDINQTPEEDEKITHNDDKGIDNEEEVHDLESNGDDQAQRDAERDKLSGPGNDLISQP